MQWPEQAAGELVEVPQLRLGPAGRVELSASFAAQADDRFEAVCGELGILLARKVEPVSARVLPFGSEQLAMVELLDASNDATQLHSSTARGASRAVAVAGAAINAMTGGNNVLAAALPGAVAEGKVRTAVVFSDGDAPVRWGLADDEGRLAALYAVVTNLGSFTATTGADTYRVLRLPGIGVALVSEGASASAWVEGWFAALLHATRFALRTDAPSTSLVATPAPPRADEPPAAETPARVLEQLEDECRRILAAAQVQASEIRAAAERDAARATAHWQQATGAPGDEHRSRAEVLEDARRDSDTLLRDAERTRATLLEDAKREIDGLRRDAERSCKSMLDDARRESKQLRKEAERTRAAVLADAKQAADDARRARERERERERDRDRDRDGGSDASRRDGRWMSDVLVGEARRTADDLLHEARRTAEEIVRDASRTRQRLLDELSYAPPAYDPRRIAPPVAPSPEPAAPQVVVVPASSLPPSAPFAAPPSAPFAAPPSAPAADGAVDPNAATFALLSAVAESITSMSALLARVASAQGLDDPATGAARRPGERDKGVPGTFYGS